MMLTLSYHLLLLFSLFPYKIKSSPPPPHHLQHHDHTLHHKSPPPLILQIHLIPTDKPTSFRISFIANAPGPWSSPPNQPSIVPVCVSIIWLRSCTKQSIREHLWPNTSRTVLRCSLRDEDEWGGLWARTSSAHRKCHYNKWNQCAMRLRRGSRKKERYSHFKEEIMFFYWSTRKRRRKGFRSLWTKEENFQLWPNWFD